MPKEVDPQASQTKTKTEEIQKTGTQFRAGEVIMGRAPGDGEEDDRRVEVSFSSDAHIPRWFGDEILDHAAGSIRSDFILSGRAPLLMDHDPRDQIGVVEKVQFGNDGKGRATVRLGKTARADDELLQIRDGIRQNVSVGYRVHKYVREEMDGDGDNSVYRATDWEPFEISLVSVPADTSVGVGRSNEQTIDTIFQRDNVMPQKTAPTTAPATTETVVTDAAQVRNAELLRMRNIEAMVKEHKLEAAMGERAIQDGTSSNEFAIQALNEIAKTRPSQVRHAEEPDIGLDEKEIKSYSFLRAMNALANPKNQALQDLAGFEIEASRAAEQKTGQAAKGILVPAEIMKRAISPLDIRAPMNVGTPTAGGNLVDTTLMTSSFIELLRAKEILSKLGAFYLTGLNGNLAIPKQTGGAAAFWVSTEGGDVSETAATIGQVPLAPKTLGAFTDLTRQFLMQSSMDAEAFARNQLVTALSLEISKKSLYGTGAAGEIKGVANQTGINTTTFGAADPTFAEVVAMETEIAADDADVDTMGYAFDARMRGHLKTKEKFASTGKTIWEEGGSVNGYVPGVSNQITQGDMFFGNWASLIVGMWGGLDLLVDPYTNSKSGTIRVVAHQSIDTAVRHPESFCHSNDGV